MRFYFDPKNPEVLEQLCIQMANAKFNYGFEYLGIQDKLVTTPLTDRYDSSLVLYLFHPVCNFMLVWFVRCFLTMTQALQARLGGSPFGPAGTGKTESVKALGNQLGRFVLVFNCDEKFDSQAMGRIFVGLCQVRRETQWSRASICSVCVIMLSWPFRSVLGAALTSSTDWRRECCPPAHSRSRPFRRR